MGKQTFSELGYVIKYEIDRRWRFTFGHLTVTFSSSPTQPIPVHPMAVAGGALLCRGAGLSVMSLVDL
jgi:hypothetical protein